ncbi:MAG: ABC transporter permease [Candidatus Adiutrix sp.]
MDDFGRIKFEFLKTALAIAIAMGLVFIIIFFASQQPLEAIKAMLWGPFSSIRRFGNVIEAMTPLMFTGLAVTMLYRAGLFNLSMEGGFFIACVAATASAVFLNLPPGINLVVAMLAGALAGGLASLIPGVLKVKCQANELVTSLMLNYVLLYFGLFIVLNFLHDPLMHANYSFTFPTDMNLSRIIPGTRITSGTIIAFACVVFVYFLLNHTAFGYKVTMVGKNIRMAEAAGINVGRTIIISQLIGGMLAGLGGATELFAMYKRFQYQGLPGYGWDGVLIAIVAQFKPQLVPLAAFFLAYIRIGADIMARQTDVPSEIVALIQAVVIVLISAEAILKGYQRRQVVRQAKQEEAFHNG